MVTPEDIFTEDRLLLGLLPMVLQTGTYTQVLTDGAGMMESYPMSTPLVMPSGVCASAQCKDTIYLFTYLPRGSYFCSLLDGRGTL